MAFLRIRIAELLPAFSSFNLRKVGKSNDAGDLIFPVRENLTEGISFFASLLSYRHRCNQGTAEVGQTIDLSKSSAAKVLKIEIKTLYRKRSEHQIGWRGIGLPIWGINTPGLWSQIWSGF